MLLIAILVQTNTCFNIMHMVLPVLKLKLMFLLVKLKCCALIYYMTVEKGCSVKCSNYTAQ